MQPAQGFFRRADGAGVRAEQPMALKGGHIRCFLVDETGGRLRAVAWRAAETPLGECLLAGAGGLSVAGKLKPDDWNGRRGVELEIEDLADPRQA